MGVPMLPVVAGDEHTSQQIWLYTLCAGPSDVAASLSNACKRGVYSLGATLGGRLFKLGAYCRTHLTGDWRDRFSSTRSYT